MVSCCNYSFGEFAHNEPIVLKDLLAEFDGDYTVKVNLPGGGKQSIKIAMMSGDEIVIPKMTLNESAVINFQVFDQWGDVVNFVNEEEGIDCPNLSLKTYINQNLTCDDNNCDPDNIGSDVDGYS